MGAANRVDYPAPLLGVVLRKSGDCITTKPENLSEAVVNAVDRLDIVGAVIAMSSDLTEALFESLVADSFALELSTTLVIPVVPSLADVGESSVQKKGRSSACLCVQESILLVWSESPRKLFDFAAELEAQLLKLVSLRPMLCYLDFLS